MISSAKAETASPSLGPPGQYPRYVCGRRGMSYSPKPRAKQSRVRVSTQVSSWNRKWRCPFPQKACSTHTVQNTTLHHCCCFPRECLIPYHSCSSACTGWMQLKMAHRGTVVFSLWESISQSIGPFLNQAIYQIDSPRQQEIIKGRLSGLPFGKIHFCLFGFFSFHPA